MEAMLETFQVPALHMAVRPVLSVYASAAPDAPGGVRDHWTGVVVNSGDSATHVMWCPCSKAMRSLTPFEASTMRPAESSPITPCRCWASVDTDSPLAQNAISCETSKRISDVSPWTSGSVTHTHSTAFACLNSQVSTSFEGVVSVAVFSSARSCLVGSCQAEMNKDASTLE